MPSSAQQLNVHYLPQFVAEYELADSTVVVVDLLRASTTISTALAAGAREVRPFVEISDTVQASTNYDRSDIILGGERGGQPIEGFDLGNSPTEYTPDVVFNKVILFTTTNGTRALEHARLASRVLVGGIVNLSAVVGSLKESPQVDILCAGTAGHVTREDILAAGAMAYQLSEAESNWQLNESAQRSRGEWQELLSGAGASAKTVSEQLALELQDTPGGKNLLAIGHGFDLETCADLDKLDVVPQMDFQSGKIYLP